MHELSIAMSLLDVAAEEAERRGGGRVVSVHVRVGQMSGVIAEALRSAFELAREGHTLSNAELAIEEVPVAVKCGNCASECLIESFPELLCPVCGVPTPDIVRGRELELVALEIES